MMNKDEFQKQLDASKGAIIAREAIKNGLKIEWETDLDKIDFSIFGYSKDKKNLRIEEVELSEFPSRVQLFDEKFNPMISSDDVSVAYFAYLINSGVKVTPPLLSYRWVIIDGELQRQGHCNCDGSHRTSFCRLVGYKSIPMIVEDLFGGYIFSVEKWSFDCGEEKICVIEKNGARKYEIKDKEYPNVFPLIEGKVMIAVVNKPLNTEELSKMTDVYCKP